MPPPAEKSCKCKKEKETKSLYASQLAIIGLKAIFTSGETEDLYMNENANSVYGHQHLRHCYQKEDKS